MKSESIILCCLLFLGHCYAQSITPITSVSLPPVTTKTYEEDYIDYIESITYNILDGPYSGEPSAIATVPPSQSRHYCSHLSDCSKVSGEPNVAPSDIGTVNGPHYAPGYNLQRLISNAKKISKEVAITTVTSTHTTTSKPKTVTVAAPTSTHPYTETLPNWNVVACDTYTVVSGRNFHLHSTSCVGSVTTISSVKPVVTLRMDATPCNWGTMSSSDIYTTISSGLMDACSKSPVPTVVERVPKSRSGEPTPTSFKTTMSACNPKTITIKNIDGPAEKVRGNYQKKTGEVLITVDKNFFDPENLEGMVNTSAHFVATSASSNPYNISFIDEAADWSGVEISYYHELMYSANSTELNWYDPGFTEYTQAFLVDYDWEETFPYSNVICDNVDEILELFETEIPELAPLIELTILFCNAEVGGPI